MREPRHAWLRLRAWVDDPTVTMPRVLGPEYLVTPALFERVCAAIAEWWCGEGWLLWELPQQLARNLLTTRDTTTIRSYTLPRGPL